VKVARYPTYQVNSYEELVEKIKSIVRAPGRRQVYRGQRRDYQGKMLVSSARPGQSSSARLRRLLEWLPVFTFWQMRTKLYSPSPESQAVSYGECRGSPAYPKGAVIDLKASMKQDPAIDKHTLAASAMMQHYGATSDFLDCSHSLETALWFSHNDMRSTEIFFTLKPGAVTGTTTNISLRGMSRRVKAPVWFMF
jgi:FRG domain